MATIAEAIQGWTDYAADLKSQRDAAVAALADSQTRLQASADALQQFQDDDAATDAQQLATQAQTDADAVQAALDAVKAQDTPAPGVVSEPVTDNPVPVGTPDESVPVDPGSGTGQ